MRYKFGLARLLLSLLSACLLFGCTLPSLGTRTVSTALSEQHARQTRLGERLESMASEHPGQSGVYPLESPVNAFAARVSLIQAAQRTVDLQYYIWRTDVTGMLLFDAVLQAAGRGVRIRILLDDNNTVGLDETLIALNSHPNIEVRLFNPFAMRKLRSLEYLFDFYRANRRMHNKALVADNRAVIVGGRNLGDEYFGATSGILFNDLDVLAVGPIVGAASRDFDRYWASLSSYPVELLLPAPDTLALKRLTVGSALHRASPEATNYLAAVRDTDLVRGLLERTLPLEWAIAKVVSDNPAKGLGPVAEEDMLGSQLLIVIGEPAHSVELISPYFIPSERAIRALKALVARGVSVRVYTNSLEATDVAAVYAGYAKRRRQLLEAGVILYEARRQSSHSAGKSGAGPFGSSGSSLHAKTVSVDQTRVFVGSYNFDPRSRNLNTELGFVFDSPALAQRLHRAFNENIARNAYEVRLDSNGNEFWIARRSAVEQIYPTAPGTTFWQRVGVWLISLLPLDWLL